MTIAVPSSGAAVTEPAPPAPAAPAPGGRLARRLEDGLVAAVLLAMALLPLAEMAARRFLEAGVPGFSPLLRHLTLWLAFLGAAIAAREGRLLSLATFELMRDGRMRRAARVVAATCGALVTVLLARASLDLVLVERYSGGNVAFGIPPWVAQAIMPVAFLAIALRLVWRAQDAWPGRAVAALGLAAGIVLGFFPLALEGVTAWPGLLLLAIATALGMPLYAALGGAAALLFLHDGVPLAALPAESYRMAVSPTLPAIPLFTLAGFLLAEGGASRRLLRLFRAFFGWLHGGTAVVVTLMFVFFTVFTGGSGVTILALGALGFQALAADGYRDRFSLGVLTGSASLGLLLPPALPVILYGIIAGVSIEELFIGGFLPALLLTALAVGWCMREGARERLRRTPFDAGEALRALAGAKWELLLPVVVVVAIFGGFATLVEAAALAALYTLVMQAFIQRDLSVRRDLPRVLTSAGVLLGGVLIILAVAMGLTSYLVDAQVPQAALAWMQAHVESPLVFLLLVNVLLLVVGALMDIFSAIVVVAPLIVPLGAAYGIDPVHLGVIFIANLELGYLTPPVGLNLFLSAYRFDRPIHEVVRATLPLLLILALGVALITFVPALTLALLDR